MSNDGPLVSMFVTCYNHQNYIQDCIKSVINQTYKNIELIIIDDGSSDNSVAKIEEMIEACKVRFVRFEFRHRPNKGISATLNEVLEWCQGVYYTGCASDDMLLPKKVEVQVDFLNNRPEISAVFGNVHFFDDDDDIIRTTKIKAQEHYFNKLLLGNNILAPTQMCRLNVIKSIGGYNAGFILEDWYMWLKILDNGYRIVSLDDVLVKYRWHGNNISVNYQKMIIGERQVLDLYKDRRFYRYALFLHKQREVIYQFSDHTFFCILFLKLIYILSKRYFYLIVFFHRALIV